MYNGYDFGYGYDYGYNYDNLYSALGVETIAALLAIVMIVITVLLIFAAVSYVFRAIGLYTIARRKGEKYPWLAFVPFARAYLQGELAGSIRLGKWTIHSPGIWRLVIPIAAGAVSSVSFMIYSWVFGVSSLTLFSADRYGSAGAGMIMLLIIFLVVYVLVTVFYEAAFRAFCILINVQIYGSFTGRNLSIVHAVLSAMVPMYESICIFVMRNKDFRSPADTPEHHTPGPEPAGDQAPGAGTPEDHTLEPEPAEDQASGAGTPEYHTPGPESAGDQAPGAGTPEDHTPGPETSEYYASAEEVSEKE